MVDRGTNVVPRANLRRPCSQNSAEQPYNRSSALGHWKRDWLCGTEGSVGGILGPPWSASVADHEVRCCAETRRETRHRKVGPQAAASPAQPLRCCCTVASCSLFFVSAPLLVKRDVTLSIVPAAWQHKLRWGSGVPAAACGRGITVSVPVSDLWTGLETSAEAVARYCVTERLRLMWPKACLVDVRASRADAHTHSRGSLAASSGVVGQADCGLAGSQFG